jgi:large subunit ribosomal protein L6
LPIADRRSLSGRAGPQSNIEKLGTEANMSRIGKMPVPVPKGVNVMVDQGNLITVKGPKGQLTQQFPAVIRFEQSDGHIQVTRPTDQKEHRALHGLSRALLNNMVLGVSQGFQIVLEVEGVGYRAAILGKNLVVVVGYSHPIEMVPPPDIRFEVDKTGRVITVTGIDKQVVGQIADRIRRLRPPEPYKGKGIRYRGELVRRKAGKTGKVGGKK